MGTCGSRAGRLAAGRSGTNPGMRPTRADSVGRVSWMAFVASLVRSLAWPAAIAVGIFILRRPLRRLALSRGIRRLKAGPVEVEFDREVAEVREDLRRRSLEQAGASEIHIIRQSQDEMKMRRELIRLVEASPEAAVTTAYAQIEARLVELLDEAGAPSYTAVGGPALVRLVAPGLIGDETVSAIDRLYALRSLAAHRNEGIGDERAREYLDLAFAVLQTAIRG